MSSLKSSRNILRRFLHPRDSRPTIQTTDPLEKTCDICANEVPSNLFPAPHILPRPCRAHCSNICQDCISKSLAVDIANKPIDRIGCPSCQQAWDRSLIDYYSTAELIVEYDSKALLQSLQTVPDFRFCLSPTCGGGQIHDGGKQEPIVTCAACGFRSCYTHRVPWHAGLSCAAFDEERSGESDKAKAKRLLKEEQEYQKIWGKGSRPCPRCKACIVKAGGCDHMRCSKCRFDFCWHCGVDYYHVRREGNQVHMSDCPHYRMPNGSMDIFYVPTPVRAPVTPGTQIPDVRRPTD